MKRALPLKKLYVVILTIFFLLTLISYAEASCGAASCSLVTNSQSGVTNKGRFVFDLSHRYILQEDKQSGSGDTSEVLVPKVNFESRTLELGEHRELKTISHLLCSSSSFQFQLHFSKTMSLLPIESTLLRYLPHSSLYSGFARPCVGVLQSSRAFYRASVPSSSAPTSRE